MAAGEPGSGTRSCSVRGRPGDTLPSAPRELAAVARVLGYRPGESGKLIDDQRRAARRARAVMERIFYD